jgi:hypothetical protein
MLPATGTEAKCPKRKYDTDRFAAITGHNDDSMGKFSYSG